MWVILVKKAVTIQKNGIKIAWLSRLDLHMKKLGDLIWFENNIIERYSRFMLLGSGIHMP